MERIVIYDTPECDVCLDWYEPHYCYFHMEVRKWSASIRRDLVRRWRVLAPYIRALFTDIYAYLPKVSPDVDAKLGKFAATFGFRFCQTLNGLDIYRWKNA